MLRRVPATIVAVEKQCVIHILSVCVCVCVSVALGIQHAMRMRHSVVSSVVCRALQYFSTLSQKRYDFRKKNY